MNEKIQGFWDRRKNLIKTTIILVTVPMLGVCVYKINQMNKIMDKYDCRELFYEDTREIEE
jgi:hypothetical protein